MFGTQKSQRHRIAHKRLVRFGAVVLSLLAASVAAAERVELERSIQVLESRQRVVPEARDRLGMHIPTGSELVQLPGGVGR